MITKNYIAKGEGANRFEKIPVQIYETADEAVKAVAREIVDLVQTKAASSEKCVLGLATGVSPIKLYQELVRMHREEGVSFRNVVTFNLDEYLPMPKESEQSYHYFMHHHLFDHIDIDPKNIHIPDGTLEGDEIDKFCRDYEKAIEAAGGIDLQILGIGRTGHIGFNEPGSFITSQTRKVFLNDLTIKDAIKDFGSRNLVPTKAITMGVGTIMQARRVILMAWGEKKAPIIKATVEGRVSDSVPATFLQMHSNVQFVIDESAASELTRADYPWLVSKVDWDDKLIRKAVIRLCQKLKKPILNPYPKRVLIFSPHPDDDVISMGGTEARLVEQGHEVHAVYQTSGNIAVFDDYLYEMMDIADLFAQNMGESGEGYKQVKETIRNLKPEGSEPKEVLKYKTALRAAEALAACRFMGIPSERVHFLNLPFYETGSVKKNLLGKEDIDIIVNLLREVKPHQIYAAGDLADPHGTHSVCLDAIMQAFDVVCEDDWFKDCYVWLYRGAWLEWEVEKVDMAVPVSPSELSIKRQAIYRHGSQNNGPAYPGDDPREFWQRAEDRNRNTADLYNKLGMAEYEAMEVFVRYKHRK